MEASSFRSVPQVLAAPFLASKIQPPAGQSALVSRRRLTNLVTAGSHSELTVVSGPAGSGKTSLLADWARLQSNEVGWLKLDRHDNDPTQFWIGFLGAIASVESDGFVDEAGELAKLARSDQRLFLSHMGDVLARSHARTTVILDDLHELRDETIHAGLGLICDRLGHCLRLIVASRTTPPLGLARRRARRQLTEVRFEDLRFTLEEGSRLVENVALGAIDDAVMSQLLHTADGWAAAIYVAAIGLDANPNASSTSGPTGRHLSDYLLEEVLGREPEHRRRFLLETSILDRLTPARCNAVTGRHDSSEVLRDLERSNQFISRVGADTGWFSYHALLRDLLLAELMLEPQNGIAELHRRASENAEAEDDRAAAIQHAISAGDLGRASGLISSSWIDFTNRGLFTTVMTWLDDWRRAELQQPGRSLDPTIFIVGSWMALHTGRLGEVEQWLSRAEASGFDGPLPDGTSCVEAAVAIVRSSHRRRIGTVTEALAASAQAMQLESDASSRWRAVACVGHGSALYWSLEFDEAADCFHEARTVAQATSLRVPMVISLGYQALIHIHNGAVAAARETASAGVGLASDAQLTGYDQAAPAFLAEGLCHLDAIELDEAEQSLHRALHLAGQGGERLLQATIRLSLMRLAELRDEPQIAATQLAAGQQIVAGCEEPGQLLLDALAVAKTSSQSDRFANVAFPSLTERELTVLRYLRSSLTLPEIATELFVSPNTIKTHAASIRSKLGVTSRDEAVRVARRIGLLPH